MLMRTPHDVWLKHKPEIEKAKKMESDGTDRINNPHKNDMGQDIIIVTYKVDGIQHAERLRGNLYDTQLATELIDKAAYDISFLTVNDLVL